MKVVRPMRAMFVGLSGLSLCVAVCASTGAAGARSNAPASCNPATSPPGWLHTDGPWIVDSRDCEIRLAGATWDGDQSTDFVPAGLDVRTYQDILSTFKQMGFNTVRIPLSDELVRDNGKITISKDVNANPELVGLHPLEVLDLIVAAAQHTGLMVILDNHFSAARHCPPKMSAKRCPANGVSLNGSGGAIRPWTDSGYTQQDWIDDWVTLADRYSSAHPCGTYSAAELACGPQAVVVGFDLHNEPHTMYGHHSWSLKDYLTRGATWGPYPSPPAAPSSLWNPDSDWAAGAEQAGDAILAVNPHLLMIVEGVQLYPDTSQPRNVEVYTWGGILRGVRVDPIRFTVGGKPVLHQLVYSPHEWGPWKDNLLNEFSYRTSFKSMKKIFMENWAFILHESGALQAPIWLGEFNTCTNSIKCVTSGKAGKQGQWFQIMLKFLHRNPEIGWSYYPVNGTNFLNETEDNGILNAAWTAPEMPQLVSYLRGIRLPSQ